MTDNETFLRRVYNRTDQEKIDDCCHKMAEIYKRLHEIMEFDQALELEVKISSFFDYVSHHEVDLHKHYLAEQCKTNLVHLKNIVKAHELLKVSEKGFKSMYG